VEEAGSGEEAADPGDDARQPFDLVFLDWKMPDGTGIELASACKRCR
jgi:CheY-like chemotaxis protein